MKIIGFFTAWACEDWIEYSIKQAIELVDELIVCISPHSKYFERIKDNTFIIAKKHLNNSKVKLLRHNYDSNKTADENKCDILNKMLQISENIEKGNLIWILDADEFFSKEAIKEIKDYLNNNNDFDEIEFKSRFFCINLNYYVMSSHIRIFKIKTTICYFTPTQRFNPPPLKKIILLNNNPMFHYSMLTGEQMRGIYWSSTEKWLIWYMKIYKSYDPLNEDFWMKKNQLITGKYRFWVTSENIVEKNNHGLFKYDGKHPELIENSPLKNISDFRTYMRGKPNYKNYLKAMKEIITEKKKINYKRLFRNKIFQIKKYLVKTLFFKNFNVKTKINTILYNLNDLITKIIPDNIFKKNFKIILDILVPNRIIFKIKNRTS